MDKMLQASFMHYHRLGEGECLADKASQVLSERIVPAFDMSCFTCLLSVCAMLLFRDHCLVRDPEIRKVVSTAIRGWNGFPQAKAGGLASISNGIGDHLSRLST